MNQLFAVALGGSCGAVLRYMVSSSIAQCLGRDFPYGTLVVNLVGSFLLGLLTETLVLQRIPLTLEYRTAILVGFIGAFTTFSTFSLETVYLLEQGDINRVLINIAGSVLGCLLVVWVGLQCGRGLFAYAGGIINWSGLAIPFALMVANAIGAFIIGVFASILLDKYVAPVEYTIAIVVLMCGAYLILSGLYLLLFQMEQGFSFQIHAKPMMVLFLSNTLICSLVIYFGFLATPEH